MSRREGNALGAETVKNSLRIFGETTAFDSIEVGAAQEESAHGADELAMVLLKRCGAIGTHLVAALYRGLVAVFGCSIGGCCGLRFSVVDHAGTQKGPSRNWTVSLGRVNTKSLT